MWYGKRKKDTLQMYNISTAPVSILVWFDQQLYLFFS